MRDKPFKIPAAEMKPLAEGQGGCFTTAAITFEGRKVARDRRRYAAAVNRR